MRFIPRWCLPVVLSLVPVTICQAGLVPRLVRDVDPTSYAGSSSPRQFFSINHGFGFTAFGGREIWTYDGQEDILGPTLKSAEIRQLADNLFASRETSGGWRFWHVEGFPYFAAMPIGTQELRRLGPVYLPQYWPQEGIILFEATGGGGHKPGLWTVQSFGGGPVEIAEPLPLPGGRLLRDLTSFRNRSFFIARHPQAGIALWGTGTAAGATALFALPPGATDLAIAGTTRTHLVLAVSGDEPALWVSDGTARGTRPLVQIGRGPATITPVAPTLPFLIVDDGRHGRQLWFTDGTAGGTRQLTHFPVRDAFGGMLPVMKVVGQHWAFFADDGMHGRELWLTDGVHGTAAGTHLLADLCPGACGTTGELLLTLPAVAPLPGRLLLTAQAPGLGNELWVTDGTAAGTALVRDLCDGPCDADPREPTVSYFTDFYGVATFTAATPDGRRALWRSDGTPEGTARLTPPGVTASTGIQLTFFGDNPFAASDAAFGDEIWTTGGTPETTAIWRDLQSEEDIGSYPLPVAAAGSKLLFTGFDPLHKRQLWTSDGTEAGTVRIPVLAPNPDFFKPPAASLGEKAVFVARGRGAAKTALWGTDGSAAGTVPLTPPDVEAGEAGGFYFTPYALGGTRALFFAKDAEHGSELWVSEGTPATTHLVVDLAPGPQSIDVAESLQATLRGQMVFGRRDDGDGRLWLTDGTAEGTRRMVDAYPFLAPIEQANSFALAEVQGKLFFIGRIPGDDGSGVDQLWISDWTAAGTHATDLVDIHGGETFFFPTASRLYIEDFLADGSLAFWVTDGTPGGTTLLPMSSDPSSTAPPPIVFGERLVLTNERDQLMATDGTATGTFVLQDPAGTSISIDYGGGVSFAGRLVLSAGNGFNPCFVWDGTGTTMIPADGVLCTGMFTAAGSRLFFPGFEPRTGVELWVFEEK